MILSGYAISKLSALPEQDAIRQDDKFFTSKILVSGVPFKEYVSRTASYGTLVERMFSDLSAAFGFRSMIHELSSDYSLADHTHGYNKFDISSEYQPSKDSTVVLATFKVDGYSIRLCMPRVWMYKQADPEIGQLRFRVLPRPPAEEINISAANFDGWVYPDGKTYYAPPGEFEAAKAKF